MSVELNIKKTLEGHQEIYIYMREDRFPIHYFKN